MPFFSISSMIKLLNKNIKISFILLFALLSCKEKKIGFNTQIRPILNKKCISCHGGVKQSGNFGLVFRENALGKTASGKYGIVPGLPEESEMISRITHQDPEMRMPIEKPPLTKEEIELLIKWVEQGANWEDHWAYLKPQNPKTPTSDPQWGNNPIDAFILKTIKTKGMSPNTEANPYDLVRRLCLDLTGLPPTEAQISNFTTNYSKENYETFVNQLLESPSYGEHWASMWLDLARYADSKGYERDRKRQIWKYRDWVIDAFNKDMPFDQFTVEQLAGDLLPNPTEDQYIATAFHRNTLANGEGGTENEEYRVASVIDRVNTTWEVWQSTTMSCVQCHSHPYDPIKHKEFYTSYAFFNNTLDWDGPKDTPLYRGYKDLEKKKLDKVKEWVETVSSKEEANKWTNFIHLQEPKLTPEDFEEYRNATHRNTADQDFMIAYNNAQIKINDLDLESIDRIYFNYKQKITSTAKIIVRKDSMNGPIIGQTILNQAQKFTNKPIKIKPNSKSKTIFLQITSNDQKYKCLVDGVLLGKKLPAPQDKQYATIYEYIDNLLNAPYDYSTPVMHNKTESFKRQTQVFDRGNWLVLTDTVYPGVPKLLNTENTKFKNRLDLAKWLVSDNNNLTARVIANRFWAQIFGKGIVLTSEDFGTLGEKPTHPELLDWLAIKFSTDWKWSVKTLLKNIVMSSTYKQSAVITAENKEKDPYNQWLARSSRVRLSAEQIRDQALAVSGLLSKKMHGPSVMPIQPDGVWTVIYSKDSWKTSQGEDAYRRGLYTYMRRSSPYPSFISFDASGRDFCLSRRTNTNTPLQALVTLNDPVYFETAFHLAQQIEKLEGGKKEKIAIAYQKVMGKSISEEKSKILMTLLNETEAYYADHKEEVHALIKSNNTELATLTVMMNSLMNMDEFLVKN